VRDSAGWLVSLAGGALLWFAATVSSGGREPWDTGAYWSVYLPIAYVLCGVLGYIFPDRSGRWPLAIFLAQMPVIWLSQGVGSLWVLGVILLLVLALPGMMLAALGSRIGRSGSKA
jgi:hypothetical protein